MNPLATAEWLISIDKKAQAKQVLDVVKPLCSTLAQKDAIGKLYAEIREFHDCLELAQDLLGMARTNQERWDARVNVIRALLNLNKPLEALKYIRINESIAPNDHPNRMDKAMAYFLLNQKDQGEQILRQILKEPRTDDIDNRVKFNLGTYDLRNGNFRQGLRRVLLDGRKLNIWHTYRLPQENLWQGGIQPGRTILMCAEGGIGDEIISVRFQKHFRDRGMKPIWYTSRLDLARIFQRCGFDVITDLKEYQPDWLWCYSMPSPSYLELDPPDLWTGAYLTPLRRQPRLKGDLKIGIKCMGNPKYDQDLHRSLPVKDVIDRLPAHATIYSFHVDEDLDDPRVTSLRDQIRTWDHTLDFLDQMDVIVSSCTSLAHAAGAMDKRTVVMVPILNYYTWGIPGTHSDWYSQNLTVLRQTEYSNWNSTLQDLEEYMREFNNP